MRIWNTQTTSYLLEFDAQGIDKYGLYAYLLDNMQGTLSAISLNKKTRISFSAAADSNAVLDRFEIIFSSNDKLTLPASLNGLQALVYPNPISGSSVNIYIVNGIKANYKALLINSMGQVVVHGEFMHPGGSALYTIPVGNQLAKGIYHLQLTAGDRKASLNISNIK